MGITSATESNGDGGNLTIETGELILQNEVGLATAAIPSQGRRREGNAGKLTILVDGLLDIQGSGGLVTANLNDGNANDLDIRADQLRLANGAVIGSAIFPLVPSSNGNQAGDITIEANSIWLDNDSDIVTSVFSGEGNGGDISITSDSIIALDDSDIIAFSTQGKGGNIILDTPAFFGENFGAETSLDRSLNLDENGRVDVNASGSVNGIVTLPDVSFIQNSLSELQGFGEDQTLNNSCIVRSNEQQGRFTATGSGGLPTQPGDASDFSFPTGEVRVPDGNIEENQEWSPGDSIIEPQGVYQLPDGSFVLSRECPR